MNLRRIGTPHEFEVAEPSAAPVEVAYAFDAAFSYLGRLIPLALFRRPVERTLVRKALWEVEKISHGLRRLA